jgi:hypothetical protein
MEALAVIKHIGMTFAIGSSTFAMIFYYAALWDGKISEDESHFMHIVFFMLRIGMCILIPWELGVMAYMIMTGNELYTTNLVHWFRIALLGISVMNATLMTKHKMPMWLAPALAGGSWYYYFFVSITPAEPSFGQLISWYIVFVVTLMIVLHILKRVLIEKKPLLPR